MSCDEDYISVMMFGGCFYQESKEVNSKHLSMIITITIWLINISASLMKH